MYANNHSKILRNEDCVQGGRPLILQKKFDEYMMKQIICSALFLLPFELSATGLDTVAVKRIALEEYNMFVTRSVSPDNSPDTMSLWHV